MQGFVPTSDSTSISTSTSSSSTSTSTSLATSSEILTADSFHPFSYPFNNAAWTKRIVELRSRKHDMWKELRTTETREQENIKLLLEELGTVVKSGITTDEIHFNNYIDFLCTSSFGLYCILAHVIKNKQKIFVSYNNSLEFDCRGRFYYEDGSFYLDFGEIKTTSDKHSAVKASTQLLIRSAPLAYAVKQLYNPSSKIKAKLRFFYAVRAETEDAYFDFKKAAEEILTEDTQNLMKLTWSPERVL